MATIKALPKNTVRLITTSQIITSVSTAVKELMENSIDAKANTIHISLVNQGLDLIEVKDDGCGIFSSDVPLICQPSSTSKISDITDLDSLSSYGFRGEALNALCQIGEVTVTTRTDSDPYATLYVFNKEGNVTSNQPSHFPKGTTITIKNLFKNMPVRKQYLSTKSRISEELKKVEKIVKSLSLIHCKLRVILTHNKCIIWQKNQVWNMRLAFSQIIPLNIVNHLEEISYVSSVNNASILMMIPKKNVSDLGALCMSNMQQAYYLYVNKRPVRNSKIEKMLSKEFSDTFKSLIPHNKYPVCLVSIDVSGDSVDVNLEPNKTKVLLKDVDNLMECIGSKIFDYYCDPNQQTKEQNTKGVETNGGKRKHTVEDEENQKVRKICKEIDTNDIRETTLSQLPLIDFNNESIIKEKNGGLEVKESHVEYKEIDSGYGVDSQMSNGTISNHSDDIITHDRFISENKDSVHENRPNDSQFNENESNQELGHNTNEFFFEIHENNESKDDISLTQWSKGNVIINNKILEEPVHINIKHTISNSEGISGNDYEDHDISPILPELNNENKELFNKINNFNENRQKHLTITSSISDISTYNGNVVSDNFINNTNLNESNPIIYESNSYFNNKLQIEEHSNNENEDNLNVSEDFSRSVSSQMGCKQYSNFTNFAREKRQEILKNQPGLSFTKVASELVKKWNQLHEDEKLEYKKSNNKPTIKTNKEKNDKSNRTMNEFIKRKTIRKYFNEQKIIVNINEIKLKLEEKINRKVENNLSSDESHHEGNIEQEEIHLNKTNDLGMNPNLEINDSTIENESNNLITKDIYSIKYNLYNTDNLTDIKENRSNYLLNKFNQLLIESKENKSNLNLKFENNTNYSSNNMEDNSIETNDNFHTTFNIFNEKDFLDINENHTNIILKKYKFNLIGEHNKNYFYYYKNNLGLISISNLYNIIIFYKYLIKYKIQSENINVPNENILLDDNLIDLIMNLNLITEKININVNEISLKIINKEFILNGIEIIIHNELNKINLEIINKPKNINFKINDIYELVNLIKCNENNLILCRPKKIQKYILNLVEDHIKSNPLQYDNNVIRKCIAYWFENIKQFKYKYLVNRNIFYKFYKLNNNCEEDEES